MYLEIVHTFAENTNCSRAAGQLYHWNLQKSVYKTYCTTYICIWEFSNDVVKSKMLMNRNEYMPFPTIDCDVTDDQIYFLEKSSDNLKILFIQIRCKAI